MTRRCVEFSMLLSGDFMEEFLYTNTRVMITQTRDVNACGTIIVPNSFVHVSGVYEEVAVVP